MNSQNLSPLFDTKKKKEKTVIYEQCSISIWQVWTNKNAIHPLKAIWMDVRILYHLSRKCWADKMVLDGFLFWPGNRITNEMLDPNKTYIQRIASILIKKKHYVKLLRSIVNIYLIFHQYIFNWRLFLYVHILFSCSWTFPIECGADFWDSVLHSWSRLIDFPGNILCTCLEYEKMKKNKTILYIIMPVYCRNTTLRAFVDCVE